jgi:hypothetical protein
MAVRLLALRALCSLDAFSGWHFCKSLRQPQGVMRLEGLGQLGKKKEKEKKKQ